MVARDPDDSYLPDGRPAVYPLLWTLNVGKEMIRTDESGRIKFPVADKRTLAACWGGWGGGLLKRK